MPISTSNRTSRSTERLARSRTFRPAAVRLVPQAISKKTMELSIGGGGGGGGSGRGKSLLGVKTLHEEANLPMMFATARLLAITRVTIVHSSLNRILLFRK